ncbi:MAG: hypothetical protein ACJAY7_000228 [Pseudohongiellaceae bacterium]
MKNMKNNIRNILSGLVFISLAMSSAQAQIPIIGGLLSAGPGLSVLDGLPVLGGGGGILGADSLNGDIPVVGAVLSGAALQGAMPVLQTVLTPEFLTDPTKVLMLLDPATLDSVSTLVFAVVGGVTTKLPLPELPGL